MNRLLLIPLLSLNAGAMAQDGPAAPARADLFAAGIVSTMDADEMHVAFTADGGRAYFVRRAAEGRFTTELGLEKQSDPLVRYRIRPMRTDSLILLEITTNFPGDSDGRTRFALPDDRFGVQEMHQWIRDVQAGAGAVLEEVEPGVHRVHHEPGAEVRISYTIAYDPGEAGFVAFGPDVGPDHFHFFGSQWMARVGPGNEPRRVEVSFDAAGWAGVLGSSYGLGPGPHSVEANDYELDYSVIAGGDYRTSRFACRGRPVLAMVHGEFDVADEAIFPLLDRIVCGQREAFDDFDRPFFTVFITERERLVAGAPVLHGFTTFMEPDISADELRGLLAHEMIHTWLPRTARLVDPERPDAPESRTRWFHEGFTEYLARLVLVRQELQPLSWLVDRTNEDLVRLAYHPYRTLTLDELDAATKERRYNNLHHRLHYLRGALLALNWDTRIRAASRGDRSLLDAVRRIVRRAQASGGTITMAEFDEAMRAFGIDPSTDIERHLERGERLAPTPGAFGPEYELVSRTAPSFDPGLDLFRMIEDWRIADIAPGGAAESAGLREGMAVVRTQNAAPWAGRWDPERPSVIVIRDDDDERPIEIRAAGPPMEIPVFR